MNMSSSVIANSVSFFMFQDQEIIARESWVVLGAIITGVTASGVVPTLLMRPTPWVESKEDKKIYEGESKADNDQTYLFGI